MVPGAAEKDPKLYLLGGGGKSKWQFDFVKGAVTARVVRFELGFCKRLPTVQMP